MVDEIHAFNSHFGSSTPRGKNITADLVAAMKTGKILEQD
jgi:hypothetical protein